MICFEEINAFLVEFQNTHRFSPHALKWWNFRILTDSRLTRSHVNDGKDNHQNRFNSVEYPRLLVETFEVLGDGFGQRGFLRGPSENPHKGLNSFESFPPRKVDPSFTCD
jgi:hypothetical protein